jgi:hypothetical protein
LWRRRPVRRFAGDDRDVELNIEIRIDWRSANANDAHQRRGRTDGWEEKDAERRDLGQ